MKNLKKVLALVVTLTMVIGLFSMMTASAAYSDVKDDATYAEAVNVLSSLAILQGNPDGTFKPDATITRAEFAAVVCRANGLESAANGAKGTTAFTDVAADHWASGYINMATQSGIIKGYGDGTFGPEDTVKYEQAIKMLVVSLGYTPKAETMGGYPSGYLAIAAQKDITAGASGNAGEPATRATVARLVYNALDVYLMTQTAYGTDPAWSESTTDTLLSTKLKVDKIEGIVTGNNANEPTAKTVKATINYTKKNGVVVFTPVNGDYTNAPNVDADVGTTNVNTLIGYSVVAYVKDIDDSSIATYIAVAPKSGENIVASVKFDNVDASTTGAQFQYWINKDTDSKTTTLDLSSSLKLYKNGLPYTLDTNATPPETLAGFLQPTTGNVTLIDNNNDSTYEYAVVTTYKDYVVDSVGTNGKIACKDGYSLTLDSTASNYKYLIYKDGKSIQPADLKEWDVLSVSSDDKVVTSSKLITVYVTSAPITGTVSEVDRKSVV